MRDSGWSSRLRRLGLDVRREERADALLFFFYCFLIGCFQFAGKTVRQSTFVDSLGTLYLPYAYLLVAVLAYPFLRLYELLALRLTRARLIAATYLAVALFLVLFWHLFRSPGNLTVWAFYVFISISTALAMSQFWSFANNHFDPRQARRLFGLISAGGLLGGVLGGQLARFLAEIETRSVLLAGAATMLVASGLLWGQSRTSSVAAEERSGDDEGDPTGRKGSRRKNGAARGEGLAALGASRKLRVIAAIVLLSVAVGQVIDLQFNWQVEQATTGLGQRTAFYGNFFSMMGLAAFFFQLLFTTPIHRQLGVGFALRVLPSGAMIGSTLLLLSSAFFPGGLLLILGGLKIGENGLRYSLDQSTRELLFVPLPADERNRAKQYIDVMVHRFGKGASAVLLLTVTFGWIAVPHASWLVLVLSIVWLGLTMAAQRHYVESLREGLTARVNHASDSLLDAADPSTLEVLVHALGSPDSGRVLHAIDLLTAHGKAHLVPPLLLHHDDDRVRRRTLEVLVEAKRRDSLLLIERTIGDEDPDVRAEAIRATAVLSDRAGVQIMHPRLGDADLRVRAAAIGCLANQGDESLRDEAEAALLELLNDENPRARSEATKALGDVDPPVWDQHLVTLLYDSSADVVRDAISAVRRRVERHGPWPIYGPILISLLRKRHLKHDAREALVAFGEAVIPALAHFMNEPHEHIWVRRAIPKTMARIATPAAAEALAQGLEARDLFLRRKVIEAVSSLDRSVPRAVVEKAAVRECRDYFQTLVRLVAIVPPGALEVVGPRTKFSDSRPQTLLEQLMAERMQTHVSNLFSLLSQLSSSRDIERAQRSLLGDSGAARNRALEYLDNILVGSVRRAVLAVVDDLPIEGRLRIGYRLFELEPVSRTETLAGIVSEIDVADEGSPWLAAAALHTICVEQLEELYPQVAENVRAPSHPLLGETAAWAANQLELQVAGGGGAD